MAISVPASAASFVVTQTLGNDILNLTIETDGKQGALGIGNLLSYTLDYGRFQFEGFGTERQAGLYVDGPSSLFAEGGNLIFDGTLGGSFVTYAEGGAVALIFSRSYSRETSSITFVENAQNLASETRPLRYSLTSSVPEPSSWLMLVVGFGMAGGALRQRNRNVTVQPVVFG